MYSTAKAWGVKDKHSQRKKCMKKFAALTICFLTLVGIIGCSDDPPSVRIVNQNANKANVQVKPLSGSTININDVQPATASPFQDIVEGTYELTAGVQNEPVAAMGAFNASNNNNYSVVILPTSPPTLRVDTQSK